MYLQIIKIHDNIFTSHFQNIKFFLKVCFLPQRVRVVLCRLLRSDAVEKGWVLDSLIETRQEAQMLSSLGVIPKHCGELVYNNHLH